MAVAREVRERDGLKLYRNSLSRRLLAVEGTARMLRAALREFPDLLGFDLWSHPSGVLMLCRTDNRPSSLAKDRSRAAAAGELVFAPASVETAVMPDPWSYGTSLQSVPPA